MNCEKYNIQGITSIDCLRCGEENCRQRINYAITAADKSPIPCRFSTSKVYISGDTVLGADGNVYRSNFNHPRLGCFEPSTKEGRLEGWVLFDPLEPDTVIPISPLYSYPVAFNHDTAATLVEKLNEVIDRLNKLSEGALL